jgi:hypothetical protein
MKTYTGGPRINATTVIQYPVKRFVAKMQLTIIMATFNTIDYAFS